MPKQYRTPGQSKMMSNRHAFFRSAMWSTTHLADWTYYSNFVPQGRRTSCSGQGEAVRSDLRAHYFVVGFNVQDSMCVVSRSLRGGPLLVRGDMRR